MQAETLVVGGGGHREDGGLASRRAGAREAHGRAHETAGARRERERRASAGGKRRGSGDGVSDGVSGALERARASRGSLRAEGFRITCPGVARRTDAGRDGRRGGSTRARTGAREWSPRDITTTRSETGRGSVAGRGGLGAPPPSRAMGVRQRRRPKPFSAANRGGAESTGSARWGAREATYAPAQRWRKRRWTPSRWTPLCLWCLELGQHVRCATPMGHSPSTRNPFASLKSAESHVAG